MPRNWDTLDEPMPDLGERGHPCRRGSVAIRTTPAIADPAIRGLLLLRHLREA